jgi:hypothetical protein
MNVSNVVYVDESRYVMIRPVEPKETVAFLASPLTSTVRSEAGPFQSPGNAGPPDDTLGIAKEIVDPLLKGVHIFLMSIEISTDAAPGTVDDKDTVAVNGGNVARICGCRIRAPRMRGKQETQSFCMVLRWSNCVGVLARVPNKYPSLFPLQTMPEATLSLVN